MTLFDLAPKESPASLFGRDAELDRLVRLVNEGRWAVVLGPRMVGKTSLVKAAGRRFERPVVYVNLWGATSTHGFIRALAHGLNANRSLLGKIRSRLRGIDGLSLGPGGLSISFPKQPLRGVWEVLDALGSETRGTVIELDEVQEVSAASGPILKLLANVFNSHPGIGFVFTGSKFGLVRTLLEPRADSPLLGRAPAEVVLQPFDPATSLAFLQRGFAEYHLKPPRAELEAVIDRSLDGLPGWLVLFGNAAAVERMSLERAERQTLRQAKLVAREELKHFLSGRHASNFWPALRVLATGASWTELREAIALRRGEPVNDFTVQGILGSLESAGIVTRKDRRYVVADPVTRSLILESRQPP